MFKKLPFSALFFTFVFCNSAFSQLKINNPSPSAPDKPNESRPKNVYDWDMWDTPNFDDLHNSQNPSYWKNKKPYEGYWQQDVYYKIQAYLNDTFEYIKGGERITYYNNSPNTITEAYFNLYQNSFNKNSITNELYKINKTKVSHGQYENQNKGIEITSFTIDNQKVEFVIYNTILKVKLPYPLKPGGKIDFNIDFITYFDRGTIRRRMKVYDHHGYKHFNGCQWFPKICVYDRKFTWTTDQHLEKEFYGDFGVFDVQLNLPENYIVEATGELMNASTAMPASLRKKIDLKNFANKPINEQPSEMIKASKNRKKWWFHATNVHDFAWTADPTYRIGEVNWKGVKCVAIAQENNASGWQKTPEYIADVIDLYSREFGLYEYPKIVAADAGDGMEYPMITMDGGLFPGHKSLLAHEIGHNWFYGMIGSNETYRAALDEGFTQFINVVALKKLGVESFPEYSRAYAGYMYDAIDGTDEPLNTHSNEFNGAIGHGGGYKHVYLKTATMLYNLQYFLGDSAFSMAMKQYVKSWKFCHPYIDDFRNSIIQSAQTDLNKFFDQWFETTKICDYSIKSVKKLKANQSKNDFSTYYDIVIERKGDMVMPVNIDIALKAKNKNLVPKNKYISVTKITIPVSFYKNPERTNVEPWIGWDQIKPYYSCKVFIPEGYELLQVWIDQSGRLADIDRTNNIWNNRVQWQFDYGNGGNESYLGSYEGLWRPAITRNDFNGWMLGAKISGQYAARKHVFNLETYYALGNQTTQDFLSTNRGTQKLSYALNYSHTIRKNGTYFLESQLYNNLFINSMGWKMKIGVHSFGLYGKTLNNLFRESESSFNNSKSIFQNRYNGIASNQGYWSHLNNINFNLFYNKNYSGWGKYGSLDFAMRLPSPWSETQYGYVQGTWKHNQPLGKLLFKTRTFAQLGGGSNVTAESALYAAGANPEEMMNNKIMRDFGFANSNVQFGGGLNLRGFTNTPIGIQQNDTTLAYFRGTSGLSVNAELEFSNLFAKLPKIKWLSIKTYLFGDAGIMAQPLNQKQTFSPLLADAGVGAVFSLNLNNTAVFGNNEITKGVMNNVKPINIRVDFPIFMNITNNNEQYNQFRFRIGIERAF